MPDIYLFLFSQHNFFHILTIFSSYFPIIHIIYVIRYLCFRHLLAKPWYATVNRYGGHRVKIHIRRFRPSTADDDVWFPTKEGIVMGVHQWRDLKAALEQRKDDPYVGEDFSLGDGMYCQFLLYGGITLGRMRNGRRMHKIVLGRESSSRLREM